MDQDELSRRDLLLALGALAGVPAFGVLAGCGEEAQPIGGTMSPSQIAAAGGAPASAMREPAAMPPAASKPAEAPKPAAPAANANPGMSADSGKPKPAAPAPDPMAANPPADSMSGAAGAGSSDAPALPPLPAAADMCTMVPEETEGPFYENAQMMRKDITEGKPGVAFKLRVRVVDISSDCKPIASIPFEIWQCDANGTYSGPKAGRASEKFLRGVQMTDESGVAEFDTIYPGWYTGRAIHVHFKAHVAGNRIVTSQLYFDEAFSREVYSANDPYKARGTNFQTNSSDFFATGYMQLMPKMTPYNNGYVGDITIGVMMG